MMMMQAPTPQRSVDRGVSETFSEQSGLAIPPRRPTPITGTWAEELPLHSREISEALYEAQRSIQLLEDEDVPDEGEMPLSEEPELEEVAFSDAGHNALGGLTPTHSSSSSNPASHVARRFKHDPYNVQEPYNVMHYCQCDSCVQTLMNATTSPSAMGLTESDLASTMGMLSMANTASYAEGGISPTTHHHPHQYPVEPHHGMMEPALSVGAEWEQPQNYYPPQQQQQTHVHPSMLPAPTAPSPVSSSVNSRQRAADPSPKPSFQTHAGLATAAGHQYQNPARQAFAIRDAMAPQTISGFMPPPPPPFVLAEVLEQEGCPNPQGVHYHIIKRWYNRVLESQSYFAPASDLCPPPDQNRYSFDAWCEMAMGWWYRHFEHMQKKKPRFSFGRRF